MARDAESTGLVDPWSTSLSVISKLYNVAFRPMPEP
jgi:hypothetical protein